MLVWEYVKIFYKEFTSPWIPDNYKKFVDAHRSISSPDIIEVEPKPVYQLVDGYYPIDLLGDSINRRESQTIIARNLKIINQTLHKFDIEAVARSHVETVSGIKYKIQLMNKTTVSHIKNKCEDLKLALDVENISFTNSKGYLGLVVEKQNRGFISLKEVITRKEYANSPVKYKVALGIDDNNSPVICDLESMENILIAGTKGSGKSSTVHAFILSLLFNLKPSDIQFMFIDLKHTELPRYNGVPHMMCPCVETIDGALSAFRRIEDIMEERNLLIGKHGVSKLSDLNKKIDPLPRIVCLVEEYAMLMNSDHKKEFNRSMKELSAVGRAAGIHMILVTQNPKSDILESTVSANFTTRIALKVAKYQHSQIILGESGAEELLGKGDMIYSDESETIRLQGCYVKDEVNRVANHLNRGECNYIELDKDIVVEPKRATGDTKYEKAKTLVIGENRASVTMMREHLGIGTSRAYKFINQLQDDGIIGEYVKEDKSYKILRSDEDELDQCTV